MFLCSNLFIMSASLRKSIFSSTELPAFRIFTATSRCSCARTSSSCQPRSENLFFPQQSYQPSGFSQPPHDVLVLEPLHHVSLAQKIYFFLNRATSLQDFHSHLTMFLCSNLFIMSASLRKSIFSSTELPAFR